MFDTTQIIGEPPIVIETVIRISPPQGLYESAIDYIERGLKYLCK